MNVRHLHWKRAARTVLLILLLSVAGMTNAFAHDFEVDNLLYTITSTNPPTVSLDGHVDGPDFEEELYIHSSVTYEEVTYAVTEIAANAFENYSLMYGDLVIPSSVTTIGDYAFYNCSSLDGTLTIGESVTSIGSYAFANLFGMTTQLSIPNSVTEMGDHAFASGNFMGSISISSSLASIPDYAFQGCAYISGDLAIPNSVTTIGNHAFDGCSNLNGKLVMSSALTQIGDYAFYQCSHLTNMGAFQTNGITHIGDYAFYRCSSLTGQLSIYNTVESIGQYAFYNCSGFTSISFNNSNPQLTSIGDWAFGNCTGFVGNLALPKSLVTIGERAFYYCTGFNGNLTFRSGIPLQSIGAYAFANCNFKNPTGLTIPNTVTTMGVGAFSGCDDFTGTLTLGSSLTAIPNYAFSGCSFNGALNLPANVTTIGENAFNNCTGFTGALTIPESVTSIGAGAFRGCTGFTQLDYNAVNCNISYSTNDSWLSGCSSLTSLNFGENVQIIPARAFSGCSNLSGELVIPASVNSIGSYAFSSNGFTSITCLAETPPALGTSVFNGISQSVSVIVPCGFKQAYISLAWGGFYNINELCSGTVTVLASPEQGGTVTGSGSFEGGQSCTVIAAANPGYVFANWTANGRLASTQSEYTFPVTGDMLLVAHFVPDSNIVFADANVKAICINHWDINGDGELNYIEAASVLDLGEYFKNNTSIISFDELQYFIGLSSIRDYAFSYCSGLVSIEMPSTLSSIGSYAFRGCSNLTGDLVIPNIVSTIGERAFYQCSGLNGSLTIGENTSSIGNYAFYQCSGITSIYCATDSPSTLGEYAFSGVNNSIPVYVPCDAIEVYQNAAWGGFTNYYSICGGMVSVTSSPEEGGVVMGSGLYEAGQYCNVMATPNPNYIFVNWTKNGTIVSTNPEYSFLVLEDVTLVAHFVFDGNIVFSDANVKNICVSHWDIDGDGELSYAEAASVTDLGNYFKYKSSITSFDELQYFIGLSAIADEAFYNCTGLTSIVLPTSVTTIGNNAFYKCSNLNCNLILGEWVSSIGNYAFYNSNIQSITTLALIPPTIKYYTFFGHYDKPLSIPCGAFGAYQSATYWSNFTNIQVELNDYFVQDGLRYEIISTNPPQVMLTGFAEGIYSAENLVIPESIYSECSGLDYAVTQIADSAFIENESLVGTLTLPASLTRIGNSAFDACIGLGGTLVIPENVTWIGRWAFYACEFTAIHYNATDCESIGYTDNNEYFGCSFLYNHMLEEIVIGDNVTQIPAYAFAFTYSQNCQLTIGNSLQTINNYAFYNDAESNTTGLSGNLVFPATLTSIGDYAFSHNYNLSGNLELPSALLTIGNSAFVDCTGLTGILTIPENVTWIGQRSFVNCRFSEIHFNAINCQSMGWDENHQDMYYVFWLNSNLQEIVIGENVTQIPDYAFGSRNSQHCHLTFLGNSVTTIGSYAFYHDESDDVGIVGALALPLSVTTINNCAFYGCSGLTEISSKSMSAPSIQNSWVFEGVDKSIPVQVPCGSLSNYQNASYWSLFTNYSETPYILVVKSNDEYLGSTIVTQYATCSDNECIIHAEANLGGYFVNWTTPDGIEITNSADYSFTLNNDITLVANFIQLEGHLNFVGGGSTNYWNDVDNWNPKQLPTETSTVGIWATGHINDDVTVASVTVYGNKQLIVYPDVSLSVTESLTTHGESLILLPEGSQLYHSNDGVNATLVRTITPYTTSENDGWYLIASPLAGNINPSEESSLVSNEYDLYAYDESTVYWINYKEEENEFNTLENGMGYLYANKGDIVASGYVPFYTYYNYSIGECLFRTDELVAAGLEPNEVLNSLCVYATNTTGYLQNGISIWMANVGDTYLANTSHNTSNMTLVYSGSMTPVVGWNEITFNQGNFTWDGTSNVLICVQRNNGAWNSTISWRCHQTDYLAVSYQYNDYNAYDMGSTTYSMDRSYNRPDIVFKTVSSNVQIGGDYTTPFSLVFAGQIENGIATVSVPLSYTETAGNLKGFNLVGNPFAHNVTSYGSVNVANGCYRMNEAKDDLIVSEISEETPLKPLEGFFVKATSADASITFNPGRSASTAKSNSIRIEVSKDNKLVDRLIVKDSEGQSLEKLNLNEQRTQVFAVQGQKEVAIVPCEGNEQPFSFKASKNGNYTISVDADDMDFTYLHLIDNLTGNHVNLLVEPSYSFEAKTTDYASRFKLVFATGSSEDPESDLFAFLNNSGNLTIFGIEGEATLQVVDVLGHVLSSEQFSDSYEKKLNVAPGVYVLRLINGDVVKTQKIIIK